MPEKKATKQWNNNNYAFFLKSNGQIKKYIN